MTDHENFVRKVHVKSFEVKNNILYLKRTTKYESRSVDDSMRIAPVYFAQFTVDEMNALMKQGIYQTHLPEINWKPC